MEIEKKNEFPYDKMFVFLLLFFLSRIPPTNIVISTCL